MITNNEILIVAGVAIFLMVLFSGQTDDELVLINFEDIPSRVGPVGGF